MEQVVGYLAFCAVHGGMCMATESHEAGARRRALLHAVSMEMNERGVDFQPGQEWIAPQGGRRRRTTRGRR